MQYPHSDRNLGIFQDMKQCVTLMGLTEIKEVIMRDKLSGTTQFVFPGYSINITFTFRPATDIVDLVLDYGLMPAEKLSDLYVLLNHINDGLAFSRFCIGQKQQDLYIRAGFFVTGYFLGKKDFLKFLSYNFGVGRTFKLLIDRLLTSGDSPSDIMKSRHTIFKEANALYGKLEKSERTQDQPFDIHSSLNLPLFPTHTHGLTALDMPEFVSLNLHYGADTIESVIKLAYEEFSRPESAGTLDSIKNGEPFKRMICHRNPGGSMVEFDLCFSKVSPDSEIVKRAYHDSQDLDPKMWFVQIYVENLRIG